MSSRLSAWARAPQPARRRGRLVPIAIMVLAGATVALVLSAPGSQRSPARTARTPSAPLRGASASTGPAPVRSAALSPALERVSRAFLSGYLAYVYGHGSAAEIPDAGRALRVSLAAHPSRVSAAIRARRPRVLSLTRVSAPRGLVAVSALINDGSVVDYRIELLVPDRGTALVSSVGAGWSR